MKRSVSWTIGVGDRCAGGNAVDPGYDELERLLEQIRVDSGSLTIDLIAAPEVGPQCLQVLSDEGCFLVTLGEDDGSEYHIRGFTNPSARDVMISILGDMWSEKIVCKNYESVKRAVKEFYETGDVSRDLLA